MDSQIETHRLVASVGIAVAVRRHGLIAENGQKGPKVGAKLCADDRSRNLDIRELETPGPQTAP
jgi:hypothetical protein